MKILFNEKPRISYASNISEHQRILDNGDAATIENKNNAQVLLFKDVEDHTDNNGFSVLWLIQGNGTFFYDGQELEMTQGDALIFDDNIEHGFGASQLCVAVNFTLEKEISLEEAKEIVTNFNIPKKKPRI